MPDAEVGRLEGLFEATPDPKLRHRVQIVPTAHRGRKHPDIAADTGTSRRSVQRWLNAYLDRGLDGLRPRKAKGAARTRGIRVGKSALRAFGARHGIRPYRPTYRFLRGDPVEQAKARDESAALKKVRAPANSSC